MASPDAKSNVGSRWRIPTSNAWCVRYGPDTTPPQPHVQESERGAGEKRTAPHDPTATTKPYNAASKTRSPRSKCASPQNTWRTITSRRHKKNPQPCPHRKVNNAFQKNKRGAGTNLVQHDSRREIQIHGCSMKLVPWDARGLTGFIHRRCGIPECQVQCRTQVVTPDPQGGGCPIWAGHAPSPTTRPKKQTRRREEKKGGAPRPNRNE